MTDEVRDAAVTFDRAAFDEEMALAEEDRVAVLEQFPLDGWPTLPLQRYTLGQDSDQMTYCRLLEFRTLHLGSIKGGSAAKHIMYRHNSGEWRLPTALQDLEVDEVWARLRTQFVAAFDAVAANDFDALDDLRLLLYGQALVTKSLAIYFPDAFLPVYSGDHLRWFIRLFGAEPEPGAATWRLNRQLRELVARRPEFDGWTGLQVMQFLYRRFDPRNQRRTIWKIAPGERGRLWDECRDAGVIRVGWDELGDLGQYERDADLKKALDQQWPESSGRNLTIARHLLQFRDLEPGDIIVANRGLSEVLGVGTVTSGYQYEPNHVEFQHVVPVEWDVSVARMLDTPQRGWRTTFAKVTPSLLATITATESAAAGSVEVPDEVQRVLAALDYKGQVVLYGPPGTGKTRLAVNAALAIADRTDVIPASDQTRNEVFKTLVNSGQVRLVTFHPSYGYEDFVEGYKPSRTATGPGLTLDLTNGVFYSLCRRAARQSNQTFLLIIDEINRGDVPRILGELITCLELDKRGLSLSLPISKRRFSVPQNLRIIGTMNTADRSISHLDAAVRRRFAFLPVDPDPDVLAGNVGPLDLAIFLDGLNARITRELDADHRLGHAYLMRDGKPVATDEDLAAAVAHGVVPVLEDYCLGRAELLRRLLGNLVDAEAGHLAMMAPQDLTVALADEFASVSQVDPDA
ncbi:MAG TPA: AAA family ATPase [Pseudonocardiaceae bacterium]|nr:AAA family ATPase [Pseudonocardiaceae bacterium]